LETVDSVVSVPDLKRIYDNTSFELTLDVEPGEGKSYVVTSEVRENFIEIQISAYELCIPKSGCTFNFQIPFTGFVGSVMSNMAEIAVCIDTWRIYQMCPIAIVTRPWHVRSKHACT